MKKKIIVLGIISIFLLAGIASASTSNHIQSSTILIEEKEKPISPNSIKLYHISGSGEGFAMKSGSVLILMKPLFSDKRITFEYWRIGDEGNKVSAWAYWIITFTFSGELIKNGDGTFSFDGDVFAWLWAGGQ